MAAPNLRVLKTPFNDEQTGKPQVWQFDLSDPKQASEYATFRNEWAMNKRREAVEAVGQDQLAKADAMTQQVQRQMPKSADLGMMAAMLGGGAVGGLAGGPVGAAFGSRALPALGAMLGSGTGAGIFEHMMGGGEPEVRSAATAGMAADLTGQLGAKALRGVGMGAMRSGVNPPEWISRDYPGTWRTAMREGLSPGSPRTRVEGPEMAGQMEAMLGNKTPHTGAAAANDLLGPAEAQVQRTIARLPQARVDLSSALRRVKYELFKPGGKFGRLPTRSAERQMVEDEIKAILSENPGAVDLERGHQLKRGAQNIASNIFKQMSDAKKNGALIDRAAEVKEIVNREFSSELLRRLNKVPGYRAAENRVQDLMGMEKAFKWRESSVPEALNPTYGSSGLRFDPFALMPQHTRGILARGLDRLAAPAARQVPAAVAPWLRPDAEAQP